MSVHHKGRMALSGLLALTLLLPAGGSARDRQSNGSEKPALVTAAYHPPEPPADPAGSNPAHGDYMPLHSGRSLTYRTVDGDRFTLSFNAPRTVRWFDGTAVQVIPVHDTRCRCHIFLLEVDGQVRAVGSQEGQEISRWGEYIVVFPGARAATSEPVTTAAGRFEHAVRVETAEGVTWFAPGVGIVRTDQYELLFAETFF
ncbi:MAG: hypothetical protein ACOY94_13975 [Bacillota bacterium]